MTGSDLHIIYGLLLYPSYMTLHLDGRQPFAVNSLFFRDFRGNGLKVYNRLSVLSHGTGEA